MLTLLKPRPEQAASVERPNRLNQIRIEPPAASLNCHVDCGIRPGRGKENVPSLGQQHDAGEEWNCLSFQTGWIAGTLPLLVKRSDFFSGSFPESNQASQCSPALATNLCYVVRVLLLRGGEANQRSYTFEERLSSGDVR